MVYGATLIPSDQSWPNSITDKFRTKHLSRATGCVPL